MRVQGPSIQLVLVDLAPLCTTESPLGRVERM